MVFLTRTVGNTLVTPQLRNPKFLNGDTDEFGCSLVLAAAMTADHSITIPTVTDSFNELVLTNAPQTLGNKSLNVPRFNEPIMTWLQAVTVATTTELGGTDIDTMLQVNGDIDGVTLQANDRVLVRQHSDADKTGIYVINAGTVPSRSQDFANGDLVYYGAVVLVRNGTTHKNSVFRMEALNGTPERQLEIGSDQLKWTLINVGADTTATLTNKTILPEDNTLRFQQIHTTYTQSMVSLNPTPVSGWHVIPCNTVGTTGMTISLPTVSNRVIITIVDETGAASVEKPIDIAAAFGENIGNDTSFSITAPFNSVTLCGGLGTRWFMM